MEQNGINTESPESKEWKKFPFEIINTEEYKEKRFLKHFKGVLAGLKHIGPEKWTMTKSFCEHAEKLYNFEARVDDVYICTFIRSGTTWTQEMIWLLCNDLNYEASKATGIDIRFPFFEFESLFPKNEIVEASRISQIETFAGMTSQRFIKTHLPMKLLPFSVLEKNCKVVYVARNPKDVIVSSFHFSQMPIIGYHGTFEEFVDCFMDDALLWSPYFAHIKDGWSRRNDKNVIFLFYEDLVMDLQGSLKKLAAFLERPLSESDLPELVNHLTFQNFKQNNSVNKSHAIKNFIRRGQIGGNPEMTPEIDEKIDEWTEKQLLGTDLKFPYQMRHKMEMYKLNINRPFKK